MKPSATIWTTSQFPYDQRLRRIAGTMESAGMDVTVWDRKTSDHSGGKIEVGLDGGPAFYLAYNRAVAQKVREIKPGLIYAADIDVMPGLMWGLGRSNNRKLLLDLHEWFPEVIELEGKPVKKTIWRWVEKRSVAYADAVITVNQSLQRLLQRKYKKEIEVIRNVPVLTAVPEVNVHKRLNSKILYYQGAINSGRGLESAIRSLHLLPGWTLWLVGDGDITAQLRELIKVECLEKRVVFKGRRPPGELPGLAVRATVGLNVLEGKSRSYYYSLANKYFDYIHALLPGLHMDFPEYRSLMDLFPTGSLLGELTPLSIAERVQEMTQNTMHYQSMIDKCYEARLRFQWQEESKKLMELLMDLQS